MDSLYALLPSSGGLLAVAGLVGTTVVITVTRALVYRVMRRG